MNLAKNWRLKNARYRMEGQQHRDGTLRFPAQPLRHGETADDWQPRVFAGTGEVFSFTVQRANAAGFDSEATTILALVKLDEGILITTQLTDCEPSEISIGTPVEMVTRSIGTPDPDGQLIYGYKFRPVVD